MRDGRYVITCDREEFAAKRGSSSITVMITVARLTTAQLNSAQCVYTGLVSMRLWAGTILLHVFFFSFLSTLSWRPCAPASVSKGFS